MRVNKCFKEIKAYIHMTPGKSTRPSSFVKALSTAASDAGVDLVHALLKAMTPEEQTDAFFVEAFVRAVIASHVVRQKPIADALNVRDSPDREVMFDEMSPLVALLETAGIQQKFWSIKTLEGNGSRFSTDPATTCIDIGISFSEDKSCDDSKTFFAIPRAHKALYNDHRHWQNLIGIMERQKVDVATADATMKRVDAALCSKRDAIVEACRELNACRTELEELKVDIADAKARKDRLVKLKADAKETQQATVAARKELASAKKDNDHVKDCIKGQADKQAVLQAKLESQRRREKDQGDAELERIEEMRARAIDTREALLEAQRTLDVERDAHVRLIDTIEELRASMDAKQRTVDELRASMDEKQRTVHELRASMDALQKETGERIVVHSNMQHAKANVVAKIKELEARLYYEKI